MKGLKEYAAILTSAVAGIVCADLLWFCTQMEVIHVIAWACFVSMGVLVGCAVFMDEDEPEEEQRGASEFVDCDGLSVLIQRSNRHE